CVWPDPTSVIDKFALRRQRLRNDRLSDKQASRKEGRHKKALKLDLYTSKCILRACSCALTGDEAIRKNCSASQHEVISYSTAYCHADTPPVPNYKSFQEFWRVKSFKV